LDIPYSTTVLAESRHLMKVVYGRKVFVRRRGRIIISSVDGFIVHETNYALMQQDV
jgi:hypothetical protein